jgi:hypothetical protein
MRWLLAALLAIPFAGLSQEMQGQLGSRDALMVLHTVQQPDGGWRVTGEYIVFPTLQRRFLEGERSPQLGITTLKEGASAIMFGHAPTGELRGTWRDGVFKGTRHGPGGQERERFEFTEHFPSMAGYSATVRCEARDGRYSATLEFSAEAGRFAAFEWRSRVQPSGHACQLADLRQQPFDGGLRLAAGDCRVTLREVGDAVKIAAEGCSEQCGSQAYLEPMLVERRGAGCRLLRLEAR